ncbi:MAG: hypothetical protein RBT11_12900 [Desulfobacterales bacterium]|jgi:hypothetical protein|nr:hypothetical protein [Desulfobacterales bacterium]
MMKQTVFMVAVAISCLFCLPHTALSKANPKIPDHLEALTGPFPDGPSVTAACLECHEEQGKEMLASAHWQWKGPTPYVAGHEKETGLGKINLINNY